MYSYKYKLTTLFSGIFLVIMALLLPHPITIIMLLSGIVCVTCFSLIQNWDINIKYWFSFIGQLCVLIFVAASFVVGLSFLAGGIN